MFLGLFLSITRYYPQIWSIFCYIQLVLLVLPQKKWCELGANPKKSHFSPIFGRYLKYAKNRGEPQKMTPSSETEFFWGWFQWESCSPGYSGHLFHQQKSRSLNKKLTFGPKYPNFGVKKAHFCPSGQLEPHRSMFWTRQRCLIGLPICGYQKFYSLPRKNWIVGPKMSKFGPKLAFWAKYWHFWPIWSNAWPKYNEDKLSRWFFHHVGTKTFTFGWWLWCAGCISQDTYLLYITLLWFAPPARCGND